MVTTVISIAALAVSVVSLYVALDAASGVEDYIEREVARRKREDWVESQLRIGGLR